MKRNYFKTVFTSLLFLSLLFAGYSCSEDKNYVSEQEIRLIIREELKNYLTQEQIIQLINNSLPPNIGEDQIRRIIAEELYGALTQDQIDQIIKAVGQGLSEAQIREIIEEEAKKAATSWEIINYNIKQGDWEWKEGSSQYEVIAELPELTEFIYENGAIIGYVFLGQQGKDEVQKLLPYINTYTDDGQTFTETISFDVQLDDPSTVAFFIKSSDLFKDPEAPQNYNFRIVLIW